MRANKAETRKLKKSWKESGTKISFEDYLSVLFHGATKKHAIDIKEHDNLKSELEGLKFLYGKQLQITKELRASVDNLEKSNKMMEVYKKFIKNLL